MCTRDELVYEMRYVGIDLGRKSRKEVQAISFCYLMGVLLYASLINQDHHFSKGKRRSGRFPNKSLPRLAFDRLAANTTVRESRMKQAARRSPPYCNPQNHEAAARIASTALQSPRVNSARSLSRLRPILLSWGAQGKKYLCPGDSAAKCCVSGFKTMDSPPTSFASVSLLYDLIPLRRVLFAVAANRTISMIARIQSGST